MAVVWETSRVRSRSLAAGEITQEHSSACASTPSSVSTSPPMTPRHSWLYCRCLPLPKSVASSTSCLPCAEHAPERVEKKRVEALAKSVDAGLEATSEFRPKKRTAKSLQRLPSDVTDDTGVLVQRIMARRSAEQTLAAGEIGQ